MKPIWKLSGKFAGWVGSSGRLYNHDGDNIGYMMDDLAYSLEGSYIGEIYHGDWIGIRLDRLHPSKGVIPPLQAISDTPLADRPVGFVPPGWDEPTF